MTPAARHISKCTIHPSATSEESQKPCYLTPWDLSVLSTNYIQKGFVFPKPQDMPMNTVLDQLKRSLSSTLTHFFPLSHRLVTRKCADPPSYYIFLDSKDGSSGAEFVHAVAEFTVSDILSPAEVPPFVDSLFLLNGAINHDGHDLPLLAVQVTELVDGIFIGCSFNHAVGDGSSFWHFINTWAEVSRSTEENIQSISRPPVTNRWFLKWYDQMINLPYSHHDEFLERYIPVPYKERILHFSSDSLAQLKAKASAECNSKNISSFQALAAFLWRSVTRARHLLDDARTICWVTIDDRSRLDPPLSSDYFGNCILAVYGTATAGELLSNNLGWSAQMLHQEVIDHTSGKVSAIVEMMTKSPHIYHYGHAIDPGAVSFGSSHRFDVYGNDFGWGAPVAVRAGPGNKYDGKMALYQGRDGGGSVDLEICLFPDSMSSLQLDPEFMSLVSL